MKRIITIQDISCLGKCSLTVALPVISAMGVECAILPTAVLSTHTMFQNFTCKDLTDQIGPIAHHWKQENIRFDAIYTGYLASAEQIDDVCRFFDQFKTEDNFIFVDPVMADNGKLYAAFDEAFPREMAKVCAKADIIVPNLTEASLLTGLPYRTDYSTMPMQPCTARNSSRPVTTGAALEDLPAARRSAAMEYRTVSTVKATAPVTANLTSFIPPRSPAKYGRAPKMTRPKTGTRGQQRSPLGAA